MPLIFLPADPSDEAFRTHWNERVASSELSLDLDFLHLLASVDPEVAYHFVQATDEAGQVCALACYSVARMRVMRFVSLRVLVLGGTVAAGKAFWFDAAALDFASFLAGFEAFVRSGVRCDMLVMKEFSPGRDDESIRAMTQAGFIAQMCYDRSRLTLPPDGQMQSFLDSLPSKKRRHLRQAMEHGEAADLEVEVHERFDHLVDAIYGLYLAVNARAREARTPALPRSLFTALGKAGGAARMMTISHDRKLIGFGLLMQRGTQLKCMVIGLDYGVSRELQLWYLIVLHSIRHALDRGCSSVDLGSTNHGMKRKFGAEREDVWLAVRHRYRWVTRLLAPVIRRTLASTYRPPARTLSTASDSA
jgi:hypothetical protein